MNSTLHSTLACLVTTTLALAQQDVTVQVLPAAPLLERLRSHHSLQCDLSISNDSESPLILRELALRELDGDANLIRRRYVNGNGTAPSLQTVVSGPIPAQSVVHIFNPFHHFDSQRLPAQLEFVFTFAQGARVWTQRIAFDAQVYEPQTELRVPLDGRVLIWDGHDFLSHHRRLGLGHPAVKLMGLTQNSSRYAGDFVLLGPDGEQTRGAPQRAQDWYGWDAPVLAPGDGRVVGLVNNFPDNRMAGGRVLQDRLVTPLVVSSLAGNYVAIEHGGGEFSLLGHLRKGSVTVALGDEVRAGEPIGNMGLSGSTSHVHLHYQVQARPDPFEGPGLPCVFERYRLHLGSKSEVVARAPVDTGDIVEHVVAKD